MEDGNSTFGGGGGAGAAAGGVGAGGGGGAGGDGAAAGTAGAVGAAVGALSTAGGSGLATGGAGVNTGCTVLGGGVSGKGLGGSTGLGGSGGLGGGGGGSAWLMAMTGTTTSTIRCNKPWCKAHSAAKWNSTTLETMTGVRDNFNVYALAADCLLWEPAHGRLP